MDWQGMALNRPKKWSQLPIKIILKNVGLLDK